MTCDVMKGAIFACRILLWTFATCSISDGLYVNVDGELTAPQHHVVRKLKAVTLVSAPESYSGGEIIDSPPVNGTIYGNSFQPGWAILSLGSGAVRQQQVAGAVTDGSQAFCATLPATGVSGCHVSMAWPTKPDYITLSVTLQRLMYAACCASIFCWFIC